MLRGVITILVVDRDQTPENGESFNKSFDLALTGYEWVGAIGLEIVMRPKMYVFIRWDHLNFLLIDLAE